ncbi:MAG: hypothetical protein KGJ90_07175, partial [Patescibacteria group bacterium]|nr:hypothetical protein [Patescibacteria group bacterium]
ASNAHGGMHHKFYERKGGIRVATKQLGNAIKRVEKSRMSPDFRPKTSLQKEALLHSKPRSYESKKPYG